MRLAFPLVLVCATACAHVRTVPADATVVALARAAVDARREDFLPSPRPNGVLLAAQFHFPDAEAPAAWGAFREHLLAITGSRMATPTDSAYWSLELHPVKTRRDSLWVAFQVGIASPCPPPDSGMMWYRSGGIAFLSVRGTNGEWLAPVLLGREEIEGITCVSRREWGNPKGGIIPIKKP